MRTIAAAVLVLGVAAAAVGAAQSVGRGTAAAAAAVSAGEARRQAILRLEDARALGGAELNQLTGYARADPFQQLALRALGRYERMELVPLLRGYLGDQAMRPTAELGMLLTLRAHTAAGADPTSDDLVDFLIQLPASAVILGQLPYSRPDQVAKAEERLRQWLGEPRGPRVAAARGLEALARRNRRLAQLGEETIALLERGATWTLPMMVRPQDEPLAFYSMAALLAAGAMDAESIAAAFRQGEDMRLLGAQALSSIGAAIDPVQRAELTKAALADTAASVRYEGLRAWSRHETRTNGCGPLAGAIADSSTHVALAAIDALGERCTDDDDITIRVLSELRMPPSIGPWQREAHALVAVARRAPERAAMAIPSFMRHTTWQVRMYAARAAALIKDAESLNTLAHDAHDNVRDAALPLLRVLTGGDSDAAFLAALGRDDLQLLRTAAIALKGAPENKYLLAALVDAFHRVTAQKKETSRDTRLVLLERIVEQGGAGQGGFYERLLADYDWKIASEAALVLQRIRGDSRTAAPRPLPRPAPPTPGEMQERLVARVELDTGRFFEIHFEKDVAPLAYARFARLTRDRYYDGLTFHRVVPNFVIQGGSPGANEYAGDALFMRDELDALSHVRGTVGTSTRGRDTGDAQFFVNLANNVRLDFEYTVIGRVPEPQMAVVDTVQEGTVIRRVRLLPPVRQ